MKLGMIKGLLPEKYPCKCGGELETWGCSCGSVAVNNLLDLLAEREIEVSVCSSCRGDKLSKRGKAVGDMIYFGKCGTCKGNGVIIKAKEL